MTLPTDWMRSAVGRSWGQVSQSLHQGAALFSRLHAAAWPGCLLSSHGYETQLPDGDHETQLQPMETQLQVRILTAYLLVNHTVITSTINTWSIYLSHRFSCSLIHLNIQPAYSPLLCLLSRACCSKPATMHRRWSASSYSACCFAGEGTDCPIKSPSP